MLKYENKRLLILNGLALACDIVNKANEKGIYTIVTDRSEDAPAKRTAHESHTIATTDVAGVVRLAKEKQVDGIITGFVDSNLQKARIICETLGLPFYATKEQLEVTMNKAKFKRLCQEHGIPVVPEFALDGNFNREDLQNIEYPVLVKPVDNTGSRGIVICNNEKELILGYNKSLQFSDSGAVLVEKFMDISKPGVNLDYVICDGDIYLSAVGDLYAYQSDQSLPPLTSAVYFPSIHTDKYIRDMDARVRNMFKSINLKNGVLFIQSFYENGVFYFYEMGYRLGGGQSYQVISRINGVNHLDMLIDYALTGVMCSDQAKTRISPKFDKKGFILILLIRPGKIKKIIGLEKIREIPEVVNVMQSYEEGDYISPSVSNTTQQGFGRVHFVADTQEQLIRAINQVKEELLIIDDKGQSMLIDNFDVSLVSYSMFEPV